MTPRPSYELEAKLRRVRLVLMDIDGTLVSADHATFINVTDQLRRLKNLNVPFSVATGRTIAGSRAIVERLWEAVGMRLATAVNYNGAVLTSPRDGSLVERHLLKPAQVTLAVDVCRELGLWPLVYKCEDTVAGPLIETVHLDCDAPPSAEFNGMLTLRSVDVGAVDRDVVAILADAGTVANSNAIAAIIRSRLGDHVRATTSGSRYVEICAPAASKASAMGRLAKLDGLSLSNIMAIGDNLNDLEMIRAAGVGVAVGNAPAEVKAAADFACNRDSAEGVVEALRMLVRVLTVNKRKEGLCQNINLRLTDNLPTG